MTFPNAKAEEQVMMVHNAKKEGIVVMFPTAKALTPYTDMLRNDNHFLWCGTYHDVS